MPHNSIDLDKFMIVYIWDEKQQLTENRVQGLYYPRFFPEKIYLPCIKFKLPSANPKEDGVKDIYYAESLHYHKRKELNEKVIITTGYEWIDGNRCHQLLTLQCDQPNEYVFYAIKAGFDIFFVGSFTPKCELNFIKSIQSWKFHAHEQSKRSHKKCK